MNSSKPKITPALPRGMRDLLPDQLAVRYKVIETLRRVFELYGFQPLETPAMERLEILSGKGGEESDKLSFLVMKRGEELQRALEKVKTENLNGSEAAKELADQGLRYDLTVPLARVAAMYQGKLPMPFKRYQIAPVWRAERPQHGRYREFTQCDIDVVGADNSLADAEIVSIFVDAYRALGLEVEVEINDRRLLTALSLACGNRDNQYSGFCTALDKLDKIGWDGVLKEMGERGLDVSKSRELQKVCDGRFQIGSSNANGKLCALGNFIQSEAILKETTDFHKLLVNLGIAGQGKVIFDPTLARGLDYYTGFVIEAKMAAGGVGSLGGGGRYDGLVGAFSKESLPAVGASFGLDRIADVLNAQVGATGPEVGVLCGGDLDSTNTAGLGEAAASLRAEGISCEITYIPTQKLGKQIQSASRRNCRFVVIVGGDEEGSEPGYQVKRLSDGEQRRLTLSQIVEWIKESK